MIRYALKCDQDHRFESWFASAAAFDTLAAQGLLACPLCDSVAVTKALMAPQVTTSEAQAATPPPTPDAAPAEAAMALSAPSSPLAAALEALRREVEANSDYVGADFVTEARRIHAGEAPERSIHGEARLEEARQLQEDGIPVAPLPFRPRSKTN